MRKATRFILAWSARELALIEHVEGIEYLLCDTSLANSAAEGLGPVDDGSQKEESLPQRTTVAATYGRLDIGALSRSSLEPGNETTVLYVALGVWQMKQRGRL